MRIHTTKQESQAVYERIASTELAGLGATSANIRRLLKSIDLVGWSSREESGRLDRRALTRFATGSTAVFSRREMKEAERAAVSVLIDCSASMTSCYDGYTTRISIAQEIAIHLAKIFNKTDVEFSVTGFTSRLGGKEMLSDGDNYHIAESAAFIRFKKWGDSLNASAAKLGAISYAAKGGTPDYAALYSALEEVSKRPESNRVLFLLTDADSYNVPNMKHLQKVADTLNVKMIAIGINAPDVTECFRHGVNVSDVNNLTGTAFNHLLKTLRK